MSALFELAVAQAPNRFSLLLTPELCVGPLERRHLFGGMALSASILAMERVCGRPVVWASAHFVRFAPCGATLDLDVDVLAEGRQTSQAAVRALIEGREVFRVSAALGARATEISGQWARMPVVDDPQAYPVASHWRGDDSGVHGRLEVRVAKGRYGQNRAGAPETDGRLLLWVRPRASIAIDAAFLAVLGDLAPAGVGNALGLNAGGNSLDNTLRILRLSPTEWVLCEILIEGLQSGFAHGTVRLFAQTGELLAVAGQSLVIRVRDEAPQLGAVGCDGRLRAPSRPEGDGGSSRVDASAPLT